MKSKKLNEESYNVVISDLHPVKKVQKNLHLKSLTPITLANLI